MPPKKDKGAADPKAAEGVEPGENPGTLLVNYTKFCKCVEGGRRGAAQTSGGTSHHSTLMM